MVKTRSTKHLLLFYKQHITIALINNCYINIYHHHMNIVKNNGIHAEDFKNGSGKLAIKCLVLFFLKPQNCHNVR